MSQEILLPVIALAAWTSVMWVWMYATRLPAMKAINMKPNPDIPRGEQMAQLPAKVRWKADNYNHLMEQPTIFYAVVISLSILGEGTSLNLVFAWSYVAARIVHSLFQSLVNKIELRFLIFALSNIPLIALIINAAMTFL